MGRIAWIEDAVDDLNGDDLQAMVDREGAIRIAREEDIGIEYPAQRVNEFVENLPSLFDWFRRSYRDFPWRRTRDPWEVIVAEILLQRTHADNVPGVYESFLKRFPNPVAVDRASEEEIFETVESLGFGNKKTNTLTTLAGTIVEEHGGKVPNDLDALQSLPRIGPYTARACLCFAFGRPFALVDANVAIVVEHAFDYSSSKRAHKDRALYAFLDALIPNQPNAARIFNLAMLDLRVLICDEVSRGQQCPLQDACQYTAGSPG